MSESGNDIIIKGGSVDLDYDEGVYPKDPQDPKRHYNAGKRITRIVISGDTNYDSDDHPSGLRCEIRVTCQ